HGVNSAMRLADGPELAVVGRGVALGVGFGLGAAVAVGRGVTCATTAELGSGVGIGLGSGVTSTVDVGPTVAFAPGATLSLAAARDGSLVGAATTDRLRPPFATTNPNETAVDASKTSQPARIARGTVRRLVTPSLRSPQPTDAAPLPGRAGRC
ncbi:MAG TPA: hypothetical protein VF802_00910, partial [Candidatus Limnocylindrales bacterium]